MNEVFLPGDSHGPRILTGYSPYSQKEFRRTDGIPFFKKKMTLGRKVMTNLESIFKSRDITLPTKVQRIGAFELWFWRRLESPLDCKEIQPLHSKGNSLEHSLEGLMLKLKLQYFGTWCEELTHLKRPWCWERLKVRGEGDDRGWDGWRVSLTQWTWVWVNSRSWWWTGRPGVLQSMGFQRVRHDWATELINFFILCPELFFFFFFLDSEMALDHPDAPLVCMFVFMPIKYCFKLL